MSIGKADGSVTRQITGVAAGSEDTDAVNVAQLKALDEKKLDKAEFTEYKKETAATLSLMQKATDNLADTKANVALDNISEDGKTVVRDLAKESVKVIAGTNTTVTEGTDGNAKTYAVDVVTDGAVASGDTGIVTGGTVYSEVRPASDGTYVKTANTTAANLAVLDTQVDQNAKDIKANTDAIGTTADGNYVKASNSVGENLGALDTQVAALAGATGADMAALGTRVSNLDGKVEKVGAGAAALAALHPLDTDSKFTMGAGFGNYRSENAMALGMFYRPNDQVMFSMGGSMGNGENLLNVGVSFALDKGVTTSKAAMAKKIAEQEEKIQTLEARLAALEAKLAK